MTDPRIGTILDGRYQILDQLAAGGMGVVYRGERLKLGRTVAIKFLHAWMATDQSFLKRFEIEARVMAKLRHPQCVSVIDFGVDGTSPYVVMDLVSGESLRSLLDRERLSVGRAMEIIRQVLSGLAHAHEQGIIHRDIKPANIMVDSSGSFGAQVRILDFGLAKLRESATGLTTGFIVGTPDYMAPEQTLAQAVDARTDVYAAAVLLFEMLTGEPPFRAQDLAEILRMHREVPAPRLASVARDAKFSRELEAVIAQALAKSPDHRFASVAAFATALDSTPEASARSGTGDPVAGRSATPRPTSSPPGELQDPVRLGTARTEAISLSDAIVGTAGGTGSLAPGPRPGLGTARTEAISLSDAIVGTVGGTAGTSISAAQTTPFPSQGSGQAQSLVEQQVSMVELPPSLPGYPVPPAAQTPPGGQHTVPLKGAGHGAAPGAWQGPGPGQGPGTPAESGMFSSAPAAAAAVGSFIASAHSALSPAVATAQAVAGSAFDAARAALAAARPGAAAGPDSGVAPAAAPAPQSHVLPTHAAQPSVQLPARSNTRPGTGPARWKIAVGALATLAVIVAIILLVTKDDPAEQDAQAAADQAAAAQAGGEPAEGTDPAAAGQEADADADPGASADEPAELVQAKSLMLSKRTRMQALRMLEKLQRKYRDNAEIPYLLGQLYFEMLWCGDGIDAYRAAIALEPMYREDPELLRSVITGLGSDRDYNRVMRFIAQEIGEPAIPYLENAMATYAREEVRERAQRTLSQIPQ